MTAAVWVGAFGVVAACGSDEGPAGSAFVADGGGASGGPSSSSGGPGISSGGASDGGSHSDAGYEKCATSTVAAQRSPLRLAIALDKSESLCETPGDGGPLECDSPQALRAAVSNALKSFFSSADSTGLEVSLLGFAGGTCQLNIAPSRAMPVTLPDTQGLLAADLDGAGFEAQGGTQTMAGIGSARKVLLGFDDAKTVKSAMLLVTDGLPTKCPAPNDQVSGLSLAEQQITLSKDAGIPVYVIGVESYRGKSSLTQLDDLAAAAETHGGKALRIDQGTPDQVTAGLLAALDEIRTVEISCELPIPTPPEGQNLNPNKVNVQLTSGATVVDAKQSDTCADPLGWHYQATDAGQNEIVLCPQLCDQSKVVGAKVDVVLGCETQRAPN